MSLGTTHGSSSGCAWRPSALASRIARAGPRPQRLLLFVRSESLPVEQRSDAGEGRRLLQVDGIDERIGVAIEHLPVGAVAAINLGDAAQRPVLGGQTADLPVLPLDHHEDAARFELATFRPPAEQLQV